MFRRLIRKVSQFMSILGKICGPEGKKKLLVCTLHFQNSEINRMVVDISVFFNLNSQVTSLFFVKELKVPRLIN